MSTFLHCPLSFLNIVPLLQKIWDDSKMIKMEKTKRGSLSSYGLRPAAQNHFSNPEIKEIFPPNFIRNSLLLNFFFTNKLFLVICDPWILILNYNCVTSIYVCCTCNMNNFLKTVQANNLLLCKIHWKCKAPLMFVKIQSIWL